MAKSEGEKLRQYLKEHKLNQEEFAGKLGITRQGLAYHFAKTRLDYEFKELLAKHGVKIFDLGKANLAPVEVNGQLFMQVPLINQYAYAGYLTGYTDPEYMEELPRIPWLVDREHKGNYVTFEVRNDSMYDGSIHSYIEGDKVLGREIPRHHWRNKLHIDNWDFIIVHKTDGILLKKITEHNTDKGTLKLHSLNPTYSDFTVKLNEVMQIFNVVQVARKK